DQVVAQRLARVMPADPSEVLGMDAIVRVEIGDQDLAQVKAFIGEDPDHPAAAPVHRGGFADDDARLQRVLDVIEAAQPVSKLLFRSEEHTSELQSRFDLVCRLLLEKK